MTQVAREAGVSLSTVSHLLNQTRQVSESTRLKVLTAAEQLGYRDHRIQELQQEQLVIGVVVPSAANPFFGEMLAGLDSEAARAGATLLISVTNEDPSREDDAVRALLQRGVDTLVIVPCHDWRGRSRARLKNASAAVVLVDRLDDPSFDQVGCSGTAATESLVRHLIDRGHTEIGMITGIPGLTTSNERLAGYLAALRGASLPIRKDWIVDGHSTVQGGRQAGLDLLRRADRPTAILCGNNNMTLGFMEALQQAGVSAPDEMAFVSFDDLEWGELMSPGITAVVQPFHAIGSQAIHLALDQLAHPARPPRTLRLDCYIEHRQSCGCADSAPLTSSWHHRG